MNSAILNKFVCNFSSVFFTKIVTLFNCLSVHLSINEKTKNVFDDVEQDNLPRLFYIQIIRFVCKNNADDGTSQNGKNNQFH